MSTQPIKIEVVYPQADKMLGKALNVREKQILCGIFQGYEDSDIAIALNTTVATVKNGRSDAYRKLGIHSIRQLFPLVIAGNFELRTGQSVTAQ